MIETITLPSDTRIGITYSFPHAMWLFGGYDAAKDAFQQIADLGVRNYRLEAYWDKLQDDGPSSLKTEYNLDWQLAITQAANADTVILCLGRKVPHWPEFHVPQWAKKLSEEEQKQFLLAYLGKLVDVYAKDSRITHWQIENEVFFAFGKGKQFTDQENFLRQEVAVIRAHDQLSRPIIVTESGDQGDWSKAATFGDILGVSFYGISYEGTKYVEHSNSTPESWKARAAEICKSVWLTELQAEPWGPSDNKNLSYAESLQSMNPERLRDHLLFVTAAGFRDVYLWGTEWWLWMKDHGHPEMWETMQQLIKNS